MSASQLTALPSAVLWMMAREEPGATMCRGGILNGEAGPDRMSRIICLLRNGLALRTLIVCPPALFDGWRGALTAGGFSVMGVAAGAACWVPHAPGGNSRPVVYLTTYAKASMYRRLLCSEAFPRVILDEGHLIRNGKATCRWGAAITYANRSTCRWILTASPVHDSYSNWKNLCMWLRVRASYEPHALSEIAAAIMPKPTVAVSETEPTVAPSAMSIQLHLMAF
jgi:hypothetical protein